jgi:hypothetical protein
MLLCCWFIQVYFLNAGPRYPFRLFFVGSQVGRHRFENIILRSTRRSLKPTLGTGWDVDGIVMVWYFWYNTRTHGTVWYQSVVLLLLRDVDPISSVAWLI